MLCVAYIEMFDKNYPLLLAPVITVNKMKGHLTSCFLIKVKKLFQINCAVADLSDIHYRLKEMGVPISAVEPLKSF